ncbi:MAG: Transcriptional regulator, AraC family [Myxococcaceae bacterium]|nr:Transcriptional regulator, AraC family [Myxococcaceae bacterium]
MQIPPGQPCYSARLLRPFLEAVREQAALPEATWAWLSGVDADERIHVSAVHMLLEAALQLTGDELLGLHASARLTMGDVGIFDFVLSSSPTLRVALENAARYLRLLNDTMDFSLEVEGERAIARFETQIALPAAAEDFRTCGLIRNHAPAWPSGMLAETEVWFRHAAPATPTALAEYERVLGPARPHFGAPLAGFGFPARYLDLPLATRDARLQDVLLRYAEGSLESLPQPESVTERVRRFVEEQLASGNFSLEAAARHLHMSSRTLGRRLSDEGTTFKNLLDEMRKRVALRYVASHDLGLGEVASLAGFTETPSFYRAFRRWTDMTPSRYRAMHRVDLRSLR